MKNFKGILLVLAFVMVCVGLTACMNDNGANAPQATVRTDFMPEMTGGQNGADEMNPMHGVGDMLGVTGTQAPEVPSVAFDWATGAGSVEANVNRISEISDSRVVTAGTTALVGVKFANAYQGEMTERIREMVAAEVKKADPSIQTVAVTAAEEDVDRVFEIAEKLRTGKPADSQTEAINEIVRNATTLR